MTPLGEINGLAPVHIRARKYHADGGLPSQELSCDGHLGHSEEARHSLNNESYVINALQFLGILAEAGKRNDKGHEAFAIHEDEAFKKAFAGLVRTAYKD